MIQLYRDTPTDVKPDVVVTVEDDDLVKVLVGRVNPQRVRVKILLKKVKNTNASLIFKFNSFS